MSLNWREIDAVLAELPLAGSQVQKIRQPDFSSLVIELYRREGRFAFYVSLAQNATRIHRLTRHVENTVQLQRFAQLLRSRLKSARICAANQIDSDRIIKIDFSRAGVETSMWIRLWSNAANIILTEPDGTIIDAFYRRPARGEVSGGVFVAGGGLRARPRAQPDGAPLSMLPGKAGDDPAGTPPAAPAAREKKTVKEYSLRDFPGKGDLNSRVEEYYFSDQREVDVGRLKQRLEKLLTGLEAKLINSVERARERIAGEDEISRYKRTGDLLMSNLHNIVPGQRLITLDNYYEEGQRLTVELDPSLSPEKNAERYYEKARKKKRRLKVAKDEVESLERELAGVLKKLDALKAENDPETLQSLLDAAAGGAGKVKERAAESIPGLTFYSGPFTIHVGRTSRENDDILRRHVRGNDYWLHSRDTPGAYVFIKSIKGKSVPLDTLIDAGTLAVHYSKAKSSGRADLYYTQVKYLRRVKDGKLGLVIPTQEKNLSVTLDEVRLRRLLQPTL